MKKHRILVVDDEENMLTLLRRVLSKDGYQVECANSGEAGINLALQHSFQLAIVDVFMPDTDGIEMLRRLKVIDKDMPVLMITAFPSWEKEEAAKQIGCAAYLFKPLDMSHLKSLIRAKIRRLED